MQKKHIAYLQMVTASVLWSAAGIFMKQINSNPFSISGFRSLFAALCVFLCIKAEKQKIILNKKTALSALFLCGTFTAFTCANKLTTAANAIVLQFTSPIFIVVISALFLHRKIKKADLIAVGATFIGIFLFFIDSMSGGALLGNIVAVGAGISLALMYITLGSAEGDERMSAVLFGQLLTAAVGLPFTFFLPFAPSSTGWLFLVLLGIFQLGIPYILVAKASGNCSPLACSLIGVVEPLLNPVWVAVFDGEMPGMWAFIGAGIILISVTLWCILSDREKA